MSIVAAAVAANDIPFVCIPAGTRSHFALDHPMARGIRQALDTGQLGVVILHPRRQHRPSGRSLTSPEPE
jgi:diacylglycerol kinase family enzyme